MIESIHVAGKKVQKWIIAILAVESESSRVVVLRVLVVLATKEIHAKGDLVLAAHKIYVICLLKGVVALYRKSRTARTKAVGDGELQVI